MGRTSERAQSTSAPQALAQQRFGHEPPLALPLEPRGSAALPEPLQWTARGQAPVPGVPLPDAVPPRWPRVPVAEPPVGPRDARLEEMEQWT